MAKQNEIDIFLRDWLVDPIKAKGAFIEFMGFMQSLPSSMEFKARPGISYSLRGISSNPERQVFALVDVVDDDPENRWLSVCFYADLVTDPEDRGDLVPAGLNGRDAMCFNLDEDDPAMRAYILERIRESARNDG